MTEQFAFAEKKNDTQDFFPDRKSMLRQSLEVFGKNKGAVAGLVIFLLILFMGLIGPSVSGYTYDDIQLQMQNLPPRIPVLEKLGICDGTVQGVNMYELKMLQTGISGLVRIVWEGIFLPDSVMESGFPF